MAAHRTRVGHAHRSRRARDPAVEQPAGGDRCWADRRAASRTLAHRRHVPTIGVRAQSELRSLGHPRAALLGFAVAVLAHNVLALLQRCVEQAHQNRKPPPDVSTYHLALHIRGSYEGMLIALPPEQWRSSNGDPAALADRLLQLARNIDPLQVATSKRRPKVAKPKGCVNGAVARAQVSTARGLAQAQAATP